MFPYASSGIVGASNYQRDDPWAGSDDRAELRLLSSARLDSHILLTVMLAGDGCLRECPETMERILSGTDEIRFCKTSPGEHAIKIVRRARWRSPHHTAIGISTTRPSDTGDDGRSTGICSPFI